MHAQNLTAIEQLYRLDSLATFKQSVKIGMFSSYDRTGGNDDGFRGTHSFIRKEAGGLVIAEMTGPGVITRIWTPTPSDDLIEFYFDGEAAPRISEKFIDLFNGKKFPFLAPVSGIGAGGFYTYLPLAYKKLVKVIDYETAYRAMIKNAEVDSPRSAYEGRELGEYNTRGYISMKYERSASRTVEYAFNDFCIATVAKGLGKTADHQKYLKRSQNWMNLWDAETKSIRPRRENGEWMKPYDKTKLYMLDSPRFTWMSAPYYEGSGYQYSTYVPHDANGLIEKVGGDAEFIKWLDNFFGEGDQNLRREGLYTQGNEPDILAAFLYIHAGNPTKTQERAREIMAKEYRTGRAGLPGNDDAGTMSSWFVWNAIGLYPNAGQDFYYIGSPIFRRSVIDSGNNRKFAIEAANVSTTNKYIQSATLNGRLLDRAWLKHSEIANGGTLRLQMSDKPFNWGNTNRPPSITK